MPFLPVLTRCKGARRLLESGHRAQGEANRAAGNEGSTSDKQDAF